MNSPLPQKKLEDRTIYLSRNDFGLQAKSLGGPVITDFGLAVRGDEPCMYNHPVQPDGYQTPEVVLRAGWSYSVDIWNLGTLVSIAQVSSIGKPCHHVNNIQSRSGICFEEMVRLIQRNVARRDFLKRCIYHVLSPY